MPNLMRTLSLFNLDASFKFGSVEEQTLLIARAFRKEDGLFLPAFTTPLDRQAAAQYRAEGLEVVCLNLNRLRLSTLRHLVQTIRRHRIEIVHWNWYHPLSGYLWMVTILTPTVQHYITDHDSRPAKMPLVGERVTCAKDHDMFEFSDIVQVVEDIIRILKRMLLKRYAKVFGVSRFVMEQMDRARVWPRPHAWVHFINTERFAPAPTVRHEVRQEMDSHNRFVLLIVAQLIPEKGVDVAIRSLKSLPESVVLWVVGEGPASGSLQDLCRQLALEDRVRFFGLQREVQPYLQAADCFVCPSRWKEAAGLVILEALACGLPVIATDIGGIPELVEDGKVGLLFRSEDHTQLADCIRRLLDHPPLRESMSKTARAVAVEQFCIHRRIDAYLAFYRVDSV